MINTLHIKHPLTVPLPFEGLNLNMRDAECTANQTAVQSETDTPINIAHRLDPQACLLPPASQRNIEPDRRRGGGGEKYESRRDSAVLRHELVIVHG